MKLKISSFPGPVCGLILAGCCWWPWPSGGAVLDTHTVVLDGTGKLLSWVAPQDRAYGHVATLSANFIKAAMTGPIDGSNGLPVIYTHSEYHPTTFTGSTWPNNPAGKHAMLADSMMLYYAYSGDTNVLGAVQSLLNFQLGPNGTTPVNYYWGNVPWSTGAAGNTNYGTDGSSEGTGMLEPDKIGELGFHGYLRFYQITGNPNYGNAAIACADALAAHVRPGNATQSPWPFRANAQTGALGATREDYCTNVVAPIRLFDELIRIGLGNTSAYAAARATAWNWLLTYPMVNDHWTNYFEDVYPIADPHYNINQYNPGQTARYLLEHPELDPNWQAHTSNLIEWIESTFGGTDQGEPGLQYGARTISEQVVYNFKMASHTGRFAAINALYAERTGDAAAKENAFRSLNWCSYMARTTGSVIEGPFEFNQNPPNWYTDGHGDYIRHFMLAMGAFPEWAPAGENHLLRSSSVIRAVSYASGGDSISYTTYDDGSTETLRIIFTPAAVLVDDVLLAERGDLTQPGWVFNASSGVLRIRHDTGTNVQIFSESPGGQPPVITTGSLPSGILNAAYTASLVASGGTTPYEWSLVAGFLPAGLTLNAASGVIAGTPGASGTYNFTVRVSDASNPVQAANKSLSLLINPSLTSVAVSPVNPSILAGAGQQFTATGTYSDASMQNISSQVTWTSSSSAVATVNASGLATGVAAGTALISAALSGKSGSSVLTVLAGPLAITTSSLPNGARGVAYTATLVASGGTTPYLWSLASGSLPAGLTLNANSGTIAGTPSTAGTSNFTVRAADSGNPPQTSTKALSIIVVDPGAGSGTIGNTTEGFLTDYIWFNGAWINAGRFQASSNIIVSTMRAKVSAIPGRYKCAIYADSSSRPGQLLRSTAEISNPGTGWQTFPLTSSLILTSGQYYWLAIWSDDVNGRVYYSGTNGNLRWGRYDYGTWPAAFTTSGGGNYNYCIYATGMAATLSSIAVTPANPVILTGGTQQFVATGTYSDGSTQNVTSQATWTSSSPAVATVNASGLAAAESAGSTTIAAALEGRSGSTVLRVQTPLSITTNSLANGTVNVAYAATLAASGGTAPYTWSLASGVLPAGLTLNSVNGAIAGTPTTAGTASFTVRVGDAGNPVQTVTKALSLSVASAPLSSIAVTPANPVILTGGTQQFVATGTYADGSTQNVTSQATWTSSSAAVATVNADGLAAAVSAGSTTIAAALGGRSGSTVLRVQTPLVITTNSLANGTVNVAYAATLAASGGTAPYTWSLASGVLPAGLTLNSASGAIAGTPTTAGTSSFTVRLNDSGNPVQTVTRALSISVVTAVSSATIWPATAVPGLVDEGPDSPVELGVKFRSDVAGSITGIRFYKSAANTGTHVGNLWTIGGTRLATATFTGESASGWQQVNFPTPVAISANTVYVASYHANNGHYSADVNFFAAAGVDNPPLHALRNGVSGGNGVYRYGTGSAFPNLTWFTANYWVDVVFRPGTP